MKIYDDIFCFSNNRKTQQRLLNRRIRALNEAIQRDSLWRGRFVVHQIKSSFYKFEDGSGAELFATLRMYDKATGATSDVFGSINDLSYGWNSIYESLNTFIIDNAWNNPTLDPRKDDTDYCKIEINKW